MALRQIRLRKQIGDLKNQLAEADKAAESLVERRNALLLREKELEEALEETTEQTSEEDRAALDSSMDEYENDLKSLETDEETNGQECKRLQNEINKLDKSVWGIFRMILNWDKTKEVFEQLQLTKVYDIFQEISKKVEEVVVYEEGPYEITSEDCVVLTPSEL